MMTYKGNATIIIIIPKCQRNDTTPNTTFKSRTIIIVDSTMAITNDKILLKFIITP